MYRISSQAKRCVRQSIYPLMRLPRTESDKMKVGYGENRKPAMSRFQSVTNSRLLVVQRVTCNQAFVSFAYAAIAGPR